MMVGAKCECDTAVMLELMLSGNRGRGGMVVRKAQILHIVLIKIETKCCVFSLSTFDDDFRDNLQKSRAQVLVVEQIISH